MDPLCFFGLSLAFFLIFFPVGLILGYGFGTGQCIKRWESARGKSTQPLPPDSLPNISIVPGYELMKKINEQATLLHDARQVVNEETK